ncbi:MAG TPA: alpha/beta hydrolase [Candidatus Kapabacteria bacterium]|nr:alpha/beta hydrolase [Candidatus Kapabacteria bacterium]
MSSSIFDHPLVTERYFFPRHEAFENPFWVDCGDARLACYFHHKHPGAKTVIFFHGNGEVVADYIDLYVPVFDQMGCNILLAEYRGYGMSTGTPALAGMLDDVSAIIDSVNQPPEQLILFGRSIGSLYALHGVYLFPTTAGLIIESGIADILERVLLRVQPSEMIVSMETLQEEVKKVFNHRQKLAGYKGATLIMHAKHDSLVNVSHGQQLHDWAPEPKTLMLFEQGDHNDILMANAQEYVLSIYRFLSTL